MTTTPPSRRAPRQEDDPPRTGAGTGHDTPTPVPAEMSVDASPRALSRVFTQTEIIESRTLLGEAREVHILHNNRLYRLRATASGKLILTA